MKEIHQAKKLTSNCNLNYKLACIITDKYGRVVGEGWNTSKTHPIQARYAAKAGQHQKINLHAEIMALIKAKGRGHNLYVIRVTKNGFGSSRPCSICQLAIREAGIKNVWYTTTQGISKL